MIYSEIIDNGVYIYVSGYISSIDTKSFISDYKQKIKGIKTTKYNLLIEVEEFNCDRISEIKNICMMFYKNGYKNIYLIDPKNYIISNIKLNALEKKLFLKAVKVVKSKEEIY